MGKESIGFFISVLIFFLFINKVNIEFYSNSRVKPAPPGSNNVFFFFYFTCLFPPVLCLPSFFPSLLFFLPLFSSTLFFSLNQFFRVCLPSHYSYFLLDLFLFSSRASFAFIEKTNFSSMQLFSPQTNLILQSLFFVFLSSLNTHFGSLLRWSGREKEKERESA